MMNITRPGWIRAKAVSCQDTEKIKGVIEDLGLHTVCEEAVCPNKGYCWSKKHVTFIILGDICTRKCKFCNITSLEASPPDTFEPENIAKAIKELKIKYAVITSVTRDDIEDGGAEHFCKVAEETIALNPGTVVELLIPDFKGDEEALKKVASSGAKVIGHNIETIKELYPDVRPQADYELSLKVLEDLNRLKETNFFIKSSIMVGLGESVEDVYVTLKDLTRAGVDIAYIGQYLSPSKHHFPVKKYYKPEEFDEIREKALELGFKVAEAGPLVRSSYMAGEAYEAMLEKRLLTIDRE